MKLSILTIVIPEIVCSLCEGLILSCVNSFDVCVCGNAGSY